MTDLAFPINKLESIPDTFESYVWADFIELLCLANIDGQLSKADLLDRVCERVDNLGEGDYSWQEDGELERSDHTDKWIQRVNDWFKHLEYRQGAFANSYPFQLSDHSSVLNLKTSIKSAQKLYLLFLFASSLRHFSQQQRSKITSIFELVSLHALKTYLPEESNSYMFGTHPLNNDRYTGKKWNKINKLAADIHEQVLCRETDFEIADTGDGGLDLVAWHSFADSARGFLLLFGQCKCAQDWVEGQAETSLDRWDKRISFTVPPVRMTFIPFCFRAVDGNWYKYDDVHKTILVDRVRLMQLLRKQHYTFEKYLSEQVDPVLGYREGIV